MKTMKLADVKAITKVEMTYEEAAKIVGANAREPFLSNMALALSLMTWRNSAEDWLRLQASLIVKAAKRKGARA